MSHIATPSDTTKVQLTLIPHQGDDVINNQKKAAIRRIVLRRRDQNYFAQI